MPDITLSVGGLAADTKTIDSAKVQRVVEAYKSHMGNPDATNADVAAFIVDQFFQAVKAVVKSYEEAAAKAAVPDSDFDY